jgi:hypothetical protein
LTSLFHNSAHRCKMQTRDIAGHENITSIGEKGEDCPDESLA